MDVVKYMYVTGKFSALCVRGGKSFPSKFLVPCSCFCFFCICYLSRCVGKKHISEISIAILFYFHWSSFIWILKMFHSWFVIYKMEFQIFFLWIYFCFFWGYFRWPCSFVICIKFFFIFIFFEEKNTIKWVIDIQYSILTVWFFKKIDHLPVCLLF